MTVINQPWVCWCKSSSLIQQYGQLNPSLFFVDIALSLPKAMHIWYHFFDPEMCESSNHSIVFTFISWFYLIPKLLICKTWWAKPRGWVNRNACLIFSEELEWEKPIWKVSLISSIRGNVPSWRKGGGPYLWHFSKSMAN